MAQLVTDAKAVYALWVERAAAKPKWKGRAHAAGKQLGLSASAVDAEIARTTAAVKSRATTARKSPKTAAQTTTPPRRSGILSGVKSMFGFGRKSKKKKAAKLSAKAAALDAKAARLEKAARKPKLGKRVKKSVKSGTHKATGWLLNGKPKKKSLAKKKNKTVIVKPRKVTVINGKKRAVGKKSTTRRRNLDHPDRSHQVQVSKHWRAGGASGWQRAAAAGQKDLFEHGIKRRNGKGKGKGKKTVSRRRNTEASAAELYERFQGREPSRELRVEGDTSMPATAATLGLLKEIKLENGTVLKFTRMDGIYLAAAKVRGKDQLFIVGRYEVEKAANLSIPLHVSRIKSVTYETAKSHIGDGKSYEFEHEFADETGGVRPWLTIDPSGKLHFTGGSYIIRAEGIRN
jgi:hypothetical protein